jgi:glycosyltransferase involved in cell wall biosynthesis
MTAMHSFIFWIRILNILSVISTLYAIKKNKGIVFLVQGTIEHGLEFIWLARLLNVRIISYIPLTDSFKSMGFVFPLFRDLLSLLTYRFCKNYYVICYSSLHKIRILNPKARINLLRNFVDEGLSGKFKCDKEKKFYEIYMIGRIVFSQKSQDGMIKAIRKLPPDIANRVRLNFVGDGPDLETLKELSQGLNVVFHGWVEKWWEAQKAIDLVVINSKFEGVPLVMLEAIALGIPVIAPDKDGMPDYLPPENLFSSSAGSVRPTLLSLLIEIFDLNPDYYLSGLIVSEKKLVYSKDDIDELERFIVEEPR